MQRPYVIFKKIVVMRHAWHLLPSLFLVFLIFSSSIVSADIVTGLVGWWRLDEGVGTVAIDSSGRGNLGTLLNTPSWDTGRLGNAVLFTAANQYIDVGLNSSLNLVSAITASGWINPSASGYVRIVQKHLGAVGYGWMLAQYENNVEWRISTNGVDWNGGITNTNPLLLNQWTHVVATYDGVNMRVFINGVENVAGWPKALSGNIHIASNSTRIGGGSTGSVSIDDIRIYNRALSAADVLELYNNGGPTHLKNVTLRNAVIK